MSVSCLVLPEDTITNLDVSVFNLARVVLQLGGTRDKCFIAVTASHHGTPFVLAEFTGGFNPFALPNVIQ